MSRRARRRILSTGLAIVLAVSVLVPAGASAERELWKEILREQLEREKSCDLNYITNERWVEVAGQASVMARAHCVDNRQFDVSWREQKQNFEIRLCQPEVC